MMSLNATVEYTYGHSYQSKKGDGRHGFIYKNSVKIEGKCSMILPIPTPDATSVAVIDTSAYAAMMNEFHSETMANSRSISAPRHLAPVKVGIYTLIVGREVQDIHDTLGVTIGSDFSNWLLNHYSETAFTFVTCIWEGDMDAQPIQIEYAPHWRDYLFFPMMESHGGIPVDDKVHRNHYLTVSTGEESHNKFRHAPPSLHDSYAGVEITMDIVNGDAYIHIETLESMWYSEKTAINFDAYPHGIAL